MTNTIKNIWQINKTMKTQKKGKKAQIKILEGVILI